MSIIVNKSNDALDGNELEDFFEGSESNRITKANSSCNNRPSDQDMFGNLNLGTHPSKY